MQWKPGRLNAKYCILTLCYLGFFDIHIIKIPKGSSIPLHLDPVPFKKHYRLNIELVKPKVGGHYKGKALFSFWRVKLIRPDIHAHSVTEIFEGHSLLLSIGWTCAK